MNQKPRADSIDERCLEGTRENLPLEIDPGLAWVRNLPCFALSALLHLIVILILIRIVYEQGAREETGNVIHVAIAAAQRAKPHEYDPTVPASLIKTPRLFDHKSPVDRPFKSRAEMDELATPCVIPEGTRFDNLTDLNTDNSDLGNHVGTNFAIGVGGNIGGPLGDRSGKGKLTVEGGNRGSERAVDGALEWLWRHQSEDGSWRAAQYTDRCKKACSNQDAERHGKGLGFDSADVGVTGLAILAFAGSGHTHQDSPSGQEKYSQCLKKAVKYLKDVQVHSEDPATDGRFGPGDHEHWIYNHAIATLALCELQLMSGDSIGLRRSAAAAVKLCLRAQNEGRGWRYGIRPGDNDTSVTGWMVLALKTAKICNLGIPREELDRSFAGALAWLNSATSASGKTGYMAPADDGSRLSNVFPDPYPYSKDLSCMTAVSILCRLFAGESRGSRVIQDGVKVLMTHLPRWQEQKGRALSTINFYYWYYGSYAMFQFGGKEWTRWNKDMIEALISSQRKGLISPDAGEAICEDGSWDPIDEWGPAGGRVYSTALGAMTLEVYYRYTRLNGGVDN